MYYMSPPHIQYNSVRTPSDSLIRAIAIFDVGIYSVGVAVIIVSFQCLLGAYLLFVAVVYVVLCPVFTVLLMYVVGGKRISPLGIIKVQSINTRIQAFAPVSPHKLILSKCIYIDHIDYIGIFTFGYLFKPFGNFSRLMGVH